MKGRRNAGKVVPVLVRPAKRGHWMRSDPSSDREVQEVKKRIITGKKIGKKRSNWDMSGKEKSRPGWCQAHLPAG